MAEPTLEEISRKLDQILDFLISNKKAHTHRFGGWSLETDGIYRRYCRDGHCVGREEIRLMGEDVSFESHND